MHLFGIGIDVVEVERIASSIDEFGNKFTERVFTESERAYCESQKRPYLHYAGRFAVKEAVAKAFGTGIGKDVGWLDMQVVRAESGEPSIQLSGVAKNFAEQNQIEVIKISLTHAKHYAAANAVVMTQPSK